MMSCLKKDGNEVWPYKCENCEGWVLVEKRPWIEGRMLDRK